MSDTHCKFNVRALDWLFGSGFNRFGRDDDDDSNQANTEYIQYVFFKSHAYLHI